MIPAASTRNDRERATFRAGGLCALEGAVGRADRCPGDACPFWEEGGAVLEAGCAIERLAVNLADPQLARVMLALRAELDVARRGGVRESRTLFDVLGRTGEL